MSLFIHILNSVHIQTEQLQLIQYLVNGFIWRGCSRVKQSVTCATVADGGLNMIHIKNLVHGLHLKWFQRMCADAGSSWSRFIWPEIETLIPS